MRYAQQMTAPTIGKYVVASAPHEGRLAWGVWEGHRVVHSGTRAACVKWANHNQDVTAPGIEWTRPEEGSTP